jgi:hypothetical protein
MVRCLLAPTATVASVLPPATSAQGNLRADSSTLRALTDVVRR